MLQAILKFSTEHRHLVVLLTIGAAAIGVWSLTVLPIDAVPDITNNQVQINTEYGALGPQEIEKQVTFPIETALAGIEGLDYTRSLSRNGFSQVVAVFHDDVGIYYARQQVLERIASAKEELPPGAEPKMGTISTGLGEVYMWTVGFEHPGGVGAAARDGTAGWQSDGAYLTPEGARLDSEFERMAYLREVQDWIITWRLKNVPGIAGVDTIGGYEKQYHIQPDPMKLIAYGLTFHDVIEALERNNASVGAGYIEHKGEYYSVRASGLIERADEIGWIVVSDELGTPIHISDVAEVEIGKELRTGSASINGREAVVGTAMMLIGANSRTVAAEVHKKLQEVRASLPPDVQAVTVYDRTTLVDATIQTVRNNLAEGAILVIVVLFLLLGNFRAALITSMAIPLSMLLAAIGMVQSKTTGNLMSLGAIDFGLIVDGSVVVVENCVRRLAERQKDLGRRLVIGERIQEVIAATRQVISPVVFGQIIIITVYIPILFLTGVEGKMFRPMALTVIFALIGAFVLSLTFVPAMMAIGMGGKVKEKQGVVIQLLMRAYVPTVDWAVRLRWLVVVVAVLLFSGSLWLGSTLGQEFVPRLDEGDIAMHAIRIPSTSLAQSQAMQLVVEEAVSALPEVAYAYSKTGTAEAASDPMPPNVSDTFVILKPESEWRTAEEMHEEIERIEHETIVPAEHDDHEQPDGHEHGDDGPETAGRKGMLVRLIRLNVQRLAGNNYEFTQPIEMRFNELISGVRADVAVKVFGDEFDDLLQSAEAVAAVMAGVPGTADLRVEQVEGLPLMNIRLDRQAVGRYGLNIADVQDVIAAAVGGRSVGLVYEGDRRFNMVVRVREEDRRDPAAIRNLPIPLPHHDDAMTVQTMLAMAGNDSSIDLLKENRPGFVPLHAIAEIGIDEGPNQISRENGKRRVVVSANVRGRDLGSYVSDAQAAIGRNLKLPAGYSLDWGGQFENLQAARQRLLVVVPICFFLIFLLLFTTFNSVRQAMLVFTGVPLALTGGIVALWLRGMPLSLSAAVGFIALSGVAVLNGLVMITFINELRRDGMELDAAIRHGAVTRLRPVLMTALVASLGFVPMAIATGRGAEVQQPLATVVIGGLITSTALTLVVLPALYRMF